MAMTDEQIERYSRHIILKEVGAKGQKKLLNASVLIIGAGGLGDLIFTGLSLLRYSLLIIGGALIFGMLDNIMGLKGLNSNVQLVAKGFLIILSVFLQAVKKED